MDTMKAKARKPLGQFLNDNSSVIAVLLLILLGTAAYGTTFLNYKKNLINVLHTASMMGIMGLGVNLCFLIGARRPWSAWSRPGWPLTASRWRWRAV